MVGQPLSSFLGVVVYAGLLVLGLSVAVMSLLTPTSVLRDDKKVESAIAVSASGAALFVSTLSHIQQQEYWQQQVYRLLSTGPRVAGTPGAAPVVAWLSQPLEDVGEDDLGEVRKNAKRWPLSAEGNRLWELQHTADSSAATSPLHCSTHVMPFTVPVPAAPPHSSASPRPKRKGALPSLLVNMTNVWYHLPPLFPSAAAAAGGHVVLAAHHDSKYIGSPPMLGASDAALSVLLLRELVREVVWWRRLHQLLWWALSRDGVTVDEGEAGEPEGLLRRLQRRRQLPQGINSTTTTTTTAAAASRTARQLLRELLAPEYAAQLLDVAFPCLHHQEKDEDPLLQWMVHAAALPAVSLVLFDGEEAVVEWGSEEAVHHPRDATSGQRNGEPVRVQDHTYGSRALVELWKQRSFSNMNVSSSSSSPSWYESVSHFLLLDLIGGQPFPTFRNLFPTASGKLFQYLSEVERKRREECQPHQQQPYHHHEVLHTAVEGVLDCSVYNQTVPLFFPKKEARRRTTPRPTSPSSTKTTTLVVEDDHMHWLSSGSPPGSVKMLHAIPVPFPPQWHTVNDDAEHVHYGSVVEAFYLFLHLVIHGIGGEGL